MELTQYGRKELQEAIDRIIAIFEQSSLTKEAKEDEDTLKAKVKRNIYVMTITTWDISNLTESINAEMKKKGISAQDIISIINPANTNILWIFCRD